MPKKSLEHETPENGENHERDSAGVPFEVEPKIEEEVLIYTLKDRCGALNGHWTGEARMVCELEAGHTGHHEAKYVRGGLNGVEQAIGIWSDAAVRRE